MTNAQSHVYDLQMTNVMSALHNVIHAHGDIAQHKPKAPLLLVCGTMMYGWLRLEGNGISSHLNASHRLGLTLTS